MKRILFVEDDLMIIRIYRGKFQSESFEVDVAMDGPSAIEAVKKNVPDLVVLDLELPKLNGVEVLKNFLSRPDMKATPIIVFSNAFMGQLVEDAWKAGATKCLTKAHCTPKQLLEIIHGMLASKGLRLAGGSTVELNYSERIPAPEALKHLAQEASSWASTVLSTSSSGGETNRLRGLEADVEAPSQPAAAPSPADPFVNAALALGGGNQTTLIRRVFIDSFPHTLGALRAQLMSATCSGDEALRHRGLSDLYRTIHSITGNAGLAGLKRIAQLASGLEAMVQELHDNPRFVNASSLRTLASAVDGLASVLQTADDPMNDTCPPVMALVVDDDLVCCRAVCAALDRAGIKSVMIEKPETALSLGERNRFDLIFLDIEMPGLNGFELASKLRATTFNAATPIIFVSSLSDFETRTRSLLNGGSDIIGKPYLMSELAVKALTWVRGGGGKASASKPQMRAAA